MFFATVGANGSVANVIKTAPSLFVFSLVQIAVHLVIILGVGKLFKFEMRELLLASNANVGGPTTAGGMATAKGWRTLLVPAILAGIFGIAIATFLAIALGLAVLSKMWLLLIWHLFQELTQVTKHVIRYWCSRCDITCAGAQSWIILEFRTQKSVLHTMYIAISSPWKAGNRNGVLEISWCSAMRSGPRQKLCHVEVLLWRTKSYPLWCFARTKLQITADG